MVKPAYVQVCTQYALKVLQIVQCPYLRDFSMRRIFPRDICDYGHAIRAYSLNRVRKEIVQHLPRYWSCVVDHDGRYDFEAPSLAVSFSTSFLSSRSTTVLPRCRKHQRARLGASCSRVCHRWAVSALVVCAVQKTDPPRRIAGRY